MSLYETRRTFQKTNASTILPLTAAKRKHHSQRHQHHHPGLNDDRRIFGMTMQQLSLVVLVIQNSVLVLVMRQSRRPPLVAEDEEIEPLSAHANNNNSKPDLYLASTAVFLAEVIKLICCTWMLYWTTTSPREYSLNGLISFLKHGLLSQVTSSHGGSDGGRGILLMMIPSGLYALQNNLLYVALSHLEAATFQVTYQLKILSTAIFSILLLDRRLRKHQWVALFLLMAGVTMVQLSTSTTATPTTDNRDEKSVGTTWIGVTAVLASCISSGFAGCFFERILKSSPSTSSMAGPSCSVWVRNIQLGICGSIFSFLGMVIYDRYRILEYGFFQGYNGMTWWVIMNQALGGLVVSMVMVHADNILKAFATSLSIILSSIISVYLFDFHPSYSFIMGTFIVLLSTYLYGHRPSSSPYKPRLIQ